MNATNAITVACIGLFGVLIGGAITAGANFVLAVRRERVEAKRDRLSRATEVRRASRLIIMELRAAETTATIYVEKRRWWVSSDIQLKTDSWQKYSDVIAPILSDAEWLAVSVAFIAIHQLFESRQLFESTRLPEVTDVDAEQTIPMLRDIQKGRLALEPYALYSRLPLS